MHPGYKSGRVPRFKSRNWSSDLIIRIIKFKYFLTRLTKW